MRQSHDHTGRRTPRNRPNPSARNSKETTRQIGNDRLLGPENRHRPARQFLHTGLRTFKTQAKAVESLDRVRRIAYRTEKRQEEDKTVCYPQTELSYLGNVSNRLAEQFYREHGVTRIDPGLRNKTFEGSSPHVHPSLYSLYAGNMQKDTRRQQISRSTHPIV